MGGIVFSGANAQLRTGLPGAILHPPTFGKDPGIPRNSPHKNSLSEEGAVQKYAPQLQHNMWVVAARNAVLSVITGGGKWVEIKVHSDPLYQHLILTAERKFWRCVENGEPPNCLGSSRRSHESKLFGLSI